MPELLSVDPWTYIFAAFLLLTIPLNWLCGAVFAAAFHECCHILSIKLMGGRVYRIQISPGGAVIDTAALSDLQELCCALAGPAGSLSLLLLCRLFPRTALAGAVQGVFNLLPVYPLDGGRALHCILGIMLPVKGEMLEKWIEYSIYAGLFCLCIYYARCFSLGFYPVLITFVCFMKLISRKSPCKARRIRVQ